MLRFRLSIDGSHRFHVAARNVNGWPRNGLKKVIGPCGGADAGWEVAGPQVQVGGLVERGVFARLRRLVGVPAKKVPVNRAVTRNGFKRSFKTDPWRPRVGL